MSFRSFTGEDWADLQLPKIKRTSARLLLLVIARSINLEGYFWLAVETMRQRAGGHPSRGAVMRDLQYLDACGVLRKAHQGGRGPRDTCSYQAIGYAEEVRRQGIARESLRRNAATQPGLFSDSESGLKGLAGESRTIQVNIQGSTPPYPPPSEPAEPSPSAPSECAGLGEDQVASEAPVASQAPAPAPDPIPGAAPEPATAATATAAAPQPKADPASPAGPNPKPGRPLAAKERRAQAARAGAGRGLTPQAMFDTWNRHAGLDSFPAAMVLNPQRVDGLLDIVSEILPYGGDLKGWDSFIRWIATQDFYCGAGPSGWRISLDWLLRPAKFTELGEKWQFAKATGEAGRRDASDEPSYAEIVAMRERSDAEEIARFKAEFGEAAWASLVRQYGDPEDSGGRDRRL